MQEVVSYGSAAAAAARLKPEAGSAAYESPRGPSRRVSFDHEYVERLKKGDPEIERHFSAYFGELLLIKLRARLHSPQAVEDLRQETFLRVLIALRRKNNLHSPESLGAFVNSVCNNILREWYRSQSQGQLSFDNFEIADGQMSAESTLVIEERKQQVRRVLEKLSEKDRELLRQVYFNDVDKDEICRRFGVDREYLRVLVHRTKARFRDELLETYGDQVGS